MYYYSTSKLKDKDRTPVLELFKAKPDDVNPLPNTKMLHNRKGDKDSKEISAY
jgi:hypothetical protein